MRGCLAPEAAPLVNSRCPRCGGEFHCGVNDAAPCACTTVALAESTRVALRDAFTGCLCIACLRELAPLGNGNFSEPS